MRAAPLIEKYLYKWLDMGWRKEEWKDNKRARMASRELETQLKSMPSVLLANKTGSMDFELGENGRGQRQNGHWLLQRRKRAFLPALLDKDHC